MANTKSPHVLPSTEEFRIAHKFRPLKVIGSGAFGVIYSGINILTKEEVAIKIEKAHSNHLQLEYEAKVYRHLVGTPYIPWMHYYGTSGEYNCLVMDLLGPSLEDLFNYCGRKFSLKTVLLLADQMIHRLEYLHCKNFIHRDIKPDNFAMGLNDKWTTVHVLDFGLAKRFRNPDTLVHNAYKEKKNLTGTARYVSKNTHMGIEQSRRDDLESLGYVFLYFLRGSLPWQGLRAKTKEDKYQKILQCKKSTPIETLCQSFPYEFVSYLRYVSSLQFDERPDYRYLRRLMKIAFQRAGYKCDFEYDWIVKYKKEPVDHNAPPDPIVAKVLSTSQIKNNNERIEQFIETHKTANAPKYTVIG